MFGSSSTTSNRASGTGRVPGVLFWGPDTAPPIGRADAVVMTPTLAAPPSALLNATCEQAGYGPCPACPVGARPGGSAGCAHGAAAAPVTDGVVLGPAQPPAAAQVGPHGPHRRRLRAHPGEEVAGRRTVQRCDRVGQQRALAG